MPTSFPGSTSSVIESSSLASVVYDTKRAILQVEFRDGTTYHYLGVPPHTYRALLGANSKGNYFNRLIRRRFPHRFISANSTSR